jgi:hypothetical protein
MSREPWQALASALWERRPLRPPDRAVLVACQYDPRPRTALGTLVLPPGMPHTSISKHIIGGHKDYDISRK